MQVAEKTTHHFMVFNDTEFLLVDPHKTKMGCGVVHFIAFLQVMYIVTLSTDRQLCNRWEKHHDLSCLL